MSDKRLFSDRPRKVDTCPRCGGRGTVDEGYALVHHEHAIAGAPKNAINATVVGCSGIFECCKEAEAIAKASRRPVAFDFSDRTVVVRPGDNADEVARRWWKAVYGETPEQSYARR